MSANETIEVVARNAAKLQEAKRRAGILTAPLLMVLGTTFLPIVAMLAKAGDLAIIVASIPVVSALALAFMIARAAIRRGELVLFASDKVIVTAIQSGVVGSRENRLSLESDRIPAPKLLEQVRDQVRQIQPEDTSCAHQLEDR